MMTAPSRAEEPRRPMPPRPPAEGRCAACGAWVATGPAGSPWLRGRCGNRSVEGMPGRKCRLYGKTQTFVFGR